MSKTIKIRKGLDIKLVGEANKVKATAEQSASFAIKPPDFHGLTPKLIRKVGEKVKAGTVIFFDKYKEDIQFVSPVSGEIEEIVRGEKRRILEVRIKADTDISYEDLGAVDPNNMTGEEVKAYLLKNGLWPFIKMRPIDVIANPEEQPKAIFISGFDSSPLAPDYDFILRGDDEAFQTGINALKKLTEGAIHLTLRGDVAQDKALTSVAGVQINKIKGKHPAGNVGTQIHHIDPINKGERVWTVNVQDVAMIGRIMKSGKYDASKVIALTGSEVKNPKYIKTILGTSINTIIKDNVEDGNIRYISGNVLTGDKIEADGYLGFYHSQITIIPEGDEPKFMITKGWMSPGFDKFSMNRSYFSWLMPKKKFELDTNLNGEVRSFVMTGEMERVFPFDIYPMHLVKSIMYNDIDLMENLGIYEVAPEDLALCEFVCTSKVNIQSVVRDGLDVIQEECM
ncbi:MAG: Na(+)-translocating NADH-quinone reductase subunit A [Crocinitomicaceae bacterium]